MTEAEREDLAQVLATTTAPQLAFAVHHRDAVTIADLLDLSRQELLALAVVLAAQVPRPQTRPDDGVIDDVAVARAVNGERVPLTKAERAQAVRALADQGAGASVISKRLHMSGASVNRVLDQVRAVA